jgi:hypothetical protein
MRTSRQLPAAPVFLIGAPRSGTSLVYKALCLHSESAYVSNWVRKFPSVPALALFNRVPRRFPGARRRAWFSATSNAYVHNARRSLDRRIFPSPAEGEPFFTACGIGLEPPLTVGESERTALQRAVERVTRYSGASVFVNKRIANNRRIPLLVDAFPNARFVNIVRDGRAVASSLARVDWWEDSVVWWYGGTPRRWAADGGDPWELCARNWVEELAVIDTGLSAVSPGAVLHLRYEDLVSAPLTTFRRVAQFAHLPGDARWETDLGDLRIEATDSWRTDLADEALKRIETIQADGLESHGYVLEAHKR